MELGQKLRCLRKRAGLSQMELAEKLLVSRQAVSNWESGASRPSTENLHYLCKFYHIQMEFLLDDNEDELPEATSAGWGEPCPPEQPSQKSRRPRIRRAAIGVVILLLICGVLLYLMQQANKGLTGVHELPGEELVPPEGPEFDLTWE